MTDHYEDRHAIIDSVHRAAQLLPHQAILENFVHHNPLKPFEDMKFRQALDHVNQLSSYMSPGERVFFKLNVDPRKRSNEALVDLSSVFLDRSAAKYAPPNRSHGFLYFFASLEGLGFFIPWRKYAREAAEDILISLQQRPDKAADLAEAILQENLDFFGILPEDRTRAIQAMLLELRGWAGMFHRMETHPEEAPDDTQVRLLDFCAVLSIFARSSIQDLGQHHWDRSLRFSTWLSDVPFYRNRDEEPIIHGSAIAYVDQQSERREGLETEFKHSLLHAISTKSVEASQGRPSLQLYTCIDDRECSLRRHVEQTNPNEIETFGVAGFFGIPIRYQSAEGVDQMILAPEGQNPETILVEGVHQTSSEHSAQFKRRRRFFAGLAQAWENASFSPIGSLILACLSPLSISRLILMGFSPTLKHMVKDRFKRIFLRTPKTDFQLPLPPAKAAALLASTFKDIGTHNRFAPIVIILGHGSVSVNNPFAAAYNCGACGGREGGPNARLMARLGNDQQVRACLLRDHNIAIPEDTMFIGGLHNTTTDTVQLYDTDLLPEASRESLKKIQNMIDEACGKNALERCQRFLLAEHVRTPVQALRHVRARSEDAAEVRPELNHASNAAVVVGRRDLTKGRFLDRRAFLSSYDPFSDDDQGTNLEHVLAPALNVCSGINLEYLFSTINSDLGAGTKAPLNVVGNIGVLQGTMGDLRTGLPSQMTEMHTPIRAHFIVDAPISRVEAVLSRREELGRLVYNDWVRLFVRDPSTNQFYKHENGNYVPIDEHLDVPTHIPFTPHYLHGLKVTQREHMVYWAGIAAMLFSCGIPIAMFGAEAMNPHGSLIAICGTLLSLPVLAFARRYLHGEFMFARFAGLCVGLLLGFNLVATAPSLMHILAGWSLFGFSSTFLIGAYNDRPTVRTNATFAFAAYRISDFALLVAATLSAYTEEIASLGDPKAIAAAGLLVAAIYKSSQFPLISLFARSMEGPTPASALGYAGLSAHVGIVLLAGTMPMWFCFDWARLTLGGIGIITAVYASLLSKIRADRKGAIANATSATIGVLFVILALGYPQLALLLAFGHAAFRMTQTLRSPNVISDTQKLRNALGNKPKKVAPEWLYRLSWALHRFNNDLNLMQYVSLMTRNVRVPTPWKLTKLQQWLTTFVIITLAGAPLTPVSHFLEEEIMELLPHQPKVAFLIMFVHFGVSVLLIRILFQHVLTSRRFAGSTKGGSLLPQTKKP